MKIELSGSPVIALDYAAYERLQGGAPSASGESHTAQSSEHILHHLHLRRSGSLKSHGRCPEDPEDDPPPASPAVAVACDERVFIVHLCARRRIMSVAEMRGRWPLRRQVPRNPRPAAVRGEILEILAWVPTQAAGRCHRACAGTRSPGGFSHEVIDLAGSTSVVGPSAIFSSLWDPAPRVGAAK